VQEQQRHAGPVIAIKEILSLEFVFKYDESHKSEI
jgi:hypothetical protein